MKVRTYNDLFTWGSPYGEHAMLHNDGACSCLIEWDGLDADLLTDDELDEAWQRLYNLIKRLPGDYITEFHCFREKDDSAAKRYLAYSDKIQRGGDFARRIRQEMADHLGPLGWSNQVAVVLTKQPVTRFSFTARKQLLAEARDAETLLLMSRSLLEALPGGRLGTTDEYRQRIRQSSDRRRYLAGAVTAYDPAYSLAEQLINERPNVVDRNLELGGRSTKVLLLYKYPDANPGWSIALLKTRCAMHVMSAVIPTETRSALKAAGKAGENTEGLIESSSSGQDYQQRKASELKQFRQWITDKDAAIVRSLYIVHLHGSAAEVEAAADAIKKRIEQQGGLFRDAAYIQRYYFRMAQPGQAYRADLYRPDSHYLVANLLPVQVWQSGDVARPEVLRLSESGQLVTFSVTDKELNHTFIGGMTRSGKDANHVAEVCELYSLGVNYCFLEVGSSYKWACQGYNGPGSYLTLDPENSVVNPLPLYTSASSEAEMPLNTFVCSETIRALSFLLTGSTKMDDPHERAAAQSALQVLYVAPIPGKVAPNLENFWAGLDTLHPDYHTPEQVAAAKRMAAYLRSFLDTTEGNIFTRDENVNLVPGMIGIDLKEVRKASEQLTIFYVVALALRFTQMAFSSRQYTQIVLNELHELVRIAPEIIGTLCSSVTRMGAKEKSFLTIITQDTSEVEILDPAILAQMPRRELLYRRDKWNTVAEKLGVPEGVTQRWSKFPYPVGLPYRESIHGYGDEYYHLRLTFPNFVLNLADSSPDALEAKERIEKLTNDPMDRIAQLGAVMGRPA